MRISERGLSLIKHFEGLRLQSYQCSAGVWTIGWGSTTRVTPNMTITESEADQRLRTDINRFERAVSRLVRVPLTDGMFSACVSLAFNIGEGAFGSSTLLRMLNAGDYRGAADQFLRWNRAGGRVLNGLTRRREAERRLFLADGIPN